MHFDTYDKTDRKWAVIANFFRSLPVRKFGEDALRNFPKKTEGVKAINTPNQGEYYLDGIARISFSEGQYFSISSKDGISRGRTTRNPTNKASV
jgi:hypothetical protein